MNRQALEISNQVKEQYEAYPYPDYSLFIPLRTQEAYASSSLFASRLREQSLGPSAIWQNSEARVFIAGCGDIFPYVLSHWEPRSHRLIAWDLSQSSLRRARLRSLFRFHHFQWQLGDLQNVQQPLPDKLAHIDSYGVLHHLANPKPVLDRFFAHLLPGGTARIMVYNSAARSWIHHLQRAFSLLELSAYSRDDLDRAQGILTLLAKIGPTFAERLNPMRGSILNNSARLVDTFFHAREARLSFAYWQEAFRSAGFQIMGLFDRYAELDDLPNPLLTFPKDEALQERIDDRRFENNFEIYLTKPGPLSADKQKPRPLPSLQRLRTPPAVWFSYEETRNLSWFQRRKLWRHALDRVSGREARPLDQDLKSFAPSCLQRLARLGVFFPDDFTSQELKTLLKNPLHASMEAPVFPNPVPLRNQSQLKRLLERTLNEKRLGLQRMELIMKRLEAAQRP